MLVGPDSLCYVQAWSFCQKTSIHTHMWEGSSHCNPNTGHIRWHQKFIPIKHKWKGENSSPSCIMETLEDWELGRGFNQKQSFSGKSP